jgi:2',3'-cyclic-nucleotide 2'-phosphodiesterase (5'-nucleotidase family)
MEGKEGQLLDANIGSEKGGKVHPSQESSRIFEVGGVKIGLIGLSTVESSTSSGFAKKLFPPYKFHPYK